MDKETKKLIKGLEESLVADDAKNIVKICRELMLKPHDVIGIENFIRVSVYFGYGLIKTGYNDEAKKALRTLMSSGMGVMDASYLLFCVAYEEKEIDEIIKYGNEFLNAIPDPKNPPESITVSFEKAHELITNFSNILIQKELYDEAVIILEKGLEITDDFPPIYVNLSLVYYRKGEFRNAEGTLLQGIKNCKDSSELHRTLGVMYEENSVYLHAELHYVDAINKGNDRAYMDLGIMYHNLFKMKDAAEMMENFINSYPDNLEAVEMLSTIKNSEYYSRPEPKISAAMIVKNEEDMLAECIESFREAVDEIVIVDTGSTDKTVEIAKSFNVKLYHHEWKDDFSEARNYSISKAEGDWILIIDADERLDKADIQNLRAAKWLDEYDSFCLPVFSTLPGHAGDANFGKHYSPRLFKKMPEHYYFGIVHNVLNLTEKVALSAAKIYHLGYDLDKDKMQRKFDRSITLLLKQVEEKPDDAFVQMNTAQMYLSRSMFDESEEYALKCIELLREDPGDQDHIYLMGLYQLSMIFLSRKEYDQCIEICLEALGYKENYIDVMINLSECYRKTDESEKAEDILVKFLEYRQLLLDNTEFNMIIYSKIGSDYEALYLLGEIYKSKKNYDLAQEKFLNSIESNPMFWKSYNSLGHILLEQENYIEAADAFENAVKYGYLNSEKYGTLGASLTEYRSAIKGYTDAISKEVNLDRSKPVVGDALAKVDELLNTQN